MLWLCLYFPQWPLQVVLRGLAEPIPMVLLQRGKVSHSNQLARQCGVHPGMKISTAHALTDRLHSMPRDLAGEAAAMQRLAAWAYAYSNQVALADEAVLIEIAGSLKLHGPLPELSLRLREGVNKLGYQCRIGVAPSASAARLFARRELTTTDPRHSFQLLQQLSVNLAPLAAGTKKKLQRTGIQRFSELLGLPRSGIRRRFGDELHTYLERLTGVQKDSHPRYHPPAKYQGELPLPAPIHASEGLLFASRRLLEELCGTLTAQDAAVQQLHWQLEHENQTRSRLSIGLASPDRNQQRWLAVLREHLANWQLPAPVTHLYLEAAQIVAYQPVQTDLLQTGQPRQGRELLLERLQARLGQDAVSGIRVKPDHRPEKSWAYAPADSSPVTPRQKRPLWLIPKPVPVDPAELRFLSRAERIETGWWDGEGYTRDYYIADHPDGRRLWVFEQYKPCRDWYIHGVFG